VLLRPLPFPGSERLFAIWAVQKGQADRTGASMPEFEDYKNQSHSFEYMANMLWGWTYTWTGQGEPRNVNCTAISDDFFPCKQKVTKRLTDCKISCHLKHELAGNKA
jgi:hypothetical protein